MTDTWTMGELAQSDLYPDETGLQPPAPGLLDYIRSGARSVVQGVDTVSNYLGVPRGEIRNAAGDVVFPTNAAEQFIQGSSDPQKAIAAAFVGPGAGKGAMPAPAVATRGAIRPPPAIMPQVAERYPQVGPPEWRKDPKTGNPYEGKLLTPEAEQVAKARQVAQKDITAGDYEPYFDVEKRTDVNAAKYPERESTLDVTMKKPETIEKYEDMARSKDASKRLNTAFERGLLQENDAGNWYFMGQLEKKFIDEYGAKLGRQLFQERFGNAMAATTGGANPTDNLIMSQYGNFLKTHGLELPDASHQYPFPVGGRYAANNMGQFDKIVLQGGGIDAMKNPKRYDFSGAFTGAKVPVIDEQMSGLFKPGMQMPPTGSYGHFAGALGDLARKQGVDPRFFQEVAWAGTKDANTKGGYRAQPMIANVNEAIERTHRITGMDRDEIVRRGLVRGEIPIYGLAGGVLGAGAMGELARQDQYN